MYTHLSAQHLMHKYVYVYYKQIKLNLRFNYTFDTNTISIENIE